MFNFPSNPAPGDAFQPAINASYMWNGEFWERGVGVLVPFITQLIPNQGPVNDATVAVRVIGGNFIAASVVSFDGVAVATTFVSASEVTCTAPSAPLAKVANVTVGHLAMTSNSLPYTYLQPAPFITVLEPASGPTGQTVPFKIKGGNFTTNSVVYFDGAVLANTFVSAAELDCVAPAKSVADNCNVTVVDGALQSNTATFSYLLKTMWLHAITPNSVDNMSGQTRIDCIGEGFKSNHQFIMGPAAQGTMTFVNSTNMWFWLFANTINMGGPNPDGTVWQCYMFDYTTGESSNSLPFTFT